MRLCNLLLHIVCLSRLTEAFVQPFGSSRSIRFRKLGLANESNSNDSEKDAEADLLKQQAEQLREQIRNMEEKLGENRKRNYDPPEIPPASAMVGQLGKSLEGKRVLVAGANGRLGSMVCRYLLRNHPKTEVVAVVHYVGENSPTSRGYGRLSYEVGAEDGIGNIGAAWSAEDRVATFEFAPEMKDYNLQNLRIVECELLDPVQCMSVAEGCDAMIWCASDFNGNQPRAVSGLNIAFLFRAVAAPTKGRVEVEGLQNMLGALKTVRMDRRRRYGDASGAMNPNDPTNVVLVSVAPDAYEDYETPFGSFKGIKSQGEQILKENFPSLSHTILQLSRFEDNFVGEGLDINAEESGTESENKEFRRINRRDAAKAAVDALLSEKWSGKTVQVWTETRR